jgi:hypothetical protein
MIRGDKKPKTNFCGVHF